MNQVHLLIATASDGAQLVLQAFENAGEARCKRKNLSESFYVDENYTFPAAATVLDCTFHVQSVFVKPTPSHYKPAPTEN